MLKFRQELEEWSREYTEEEWTGKISSLSLSGLALSPGILLAGRLR